MLSETLEQERRLVDYLLGRLPASERAELDNRLFTEDDFHDELVATLDDLIQAYLQGALSREDRARFESEILASPRHRERVAFVKQVLSAVEALPAPDLDVRTASSRLAPGPRRTWLLVAAVVLAAFAAVIGVALRGGPQPTERVARATPFSPPAAVSPAATPAAPRGPSAGRDTVRTVRLPALAAAAVEVALTAATRTVHIEVPIGQQGPGFNAAIRTATGRLVWRARGLPPTEPGRPLVLDVPAAVLGSGLYRVRVEAEALRQSTAPSALAVEYDIHVTRGR
jgi:hypothetical protein